MNSRLRWLRDKPETGLARITAHSLSSKLHDGTTRFAVAMSAAIALCVAGVLMDGQPTELQAAQDVADYSAALADGGVSLCKEFGRVPVWTKSGDLVCRVPPAVLAQGGVL